MTKRFYGYGGFPIKKNTKKISCVILLKWKRFQAKKEYF